MLKNSAFAMVLLLALPVHNAFATNWCGYVEDYSVYEIDVFGGRNAVAKDISETDLIAGEGERADGSVRGFLRSVHGEIHDLGILPGGTFSSANAVSDNGVVVGIADVRGDKESAIRTRAFVWTQENGMRALPDLDSKASSFAEDINSEGTIVGSSGGVAVIWKNGKVIPLGTLGGKNSYATSINRKGWTVGNSEMPDGSVHAFVHRDGVMRDIGTLGGANSYARSMDELGNVVGNSETEDGSVHAFRWNAIEGIQDKDAGMGGSTAHHMSPFGLGSGGGYSLETGKLQAMLWNWDESTLDLGVLPGTENSYAFAVNDLGTVVGYSFNKNQSRAVYWKRCGAFE